MKDTVQLPTEIWLAIVKLTGRKADMAILSRVSQRFRAMLQPELFWLAIKENDSAITLNATISGNLDTLKIAASCGTSLNTIYRLRTPKWLRETTIPIAKEDELPIPRSPEEQLPEMGMGSLIHIATICGHYRVVQWLVEQQVDLEAPGRFLCQCAPLGTIPFSNKHITCGRDPSDFPPWTALHYALCKRQDSIARLLISAGASCDDVRVPVSTALQKLSDRVHAAMPPPSRPLQENERYADEKRNRHPIPALHVAAASDRRRLMTYLVRDLGMDVETKDGQGATALHYAVICRENHDTCEFRGTPKYDQAAHSEDELGFSLLSSDDGTSDTTESTAQIDQDDQPDWKLCMVELMISRLGADGHARFHHSRAGAAFDVLEFAIVTASDSCQDYLLERGGFSWIWIDENNRKEARVKFLLDDAERYVNEPPQASSEGFSPRIFLDNLVRDLDYIIRTAGRTHDPAGGCADLRSELSTVFCQIASSPNLPGDIAYTISRLVNGWSRDELYSGHIYNHEFDLKRHLDGFELPRHASTTTFTLAFCFTISNWPKNDNHGLKQRVRELIWTMKKARTPMSLAGDMAFSPIACIFKRMMECKSDPTDFEDTINKLAEIGAWYPLEGQSNLPALLRDLDFKWSADRFHEIIKKSMPEEVVDNLPQDTTRCCTCCRCSQGGSAPVGPGLGVNEKQT